MKFSIILVVLLLWPAPPPVGASAAGVEDRTSSVETRALLAEIIAGEQRSEAQKARDRYRHPLETLTFFGLEPDLTVVEIWPGGQGSWYRSIIEPLIETGSGRYFPVAQRSAFPEPLAYIPYGEVDMVLVFRAHGFMIYGWPAQMHVNALFRMLKPGGIFGIVDHAGDEAVPQDPEGANGYVNESYFREMAEKAGFMLLGASDVNRNPADDKHHANGVYSLPPDMRGSTEGSPLREGYRAIGESDRFTLKYYKPLAAGSDN